MASNLDILSFLKADKDARVKEKEEEKVLRAQERQEDMRKISDMIKSGVKEEVMAAIQPIDERLVQQEKVTTGLSSQLINIMKEIEVIKETTKTRQEFPALSEQQTPSLNRQHLGASREVRGQQELRERVHGVSDNTTEEQRDYSRNVRELCASARRVIGFTPIEPRMLELQIRSYGARNTEEAMLMEIKSYLKCEMKILPSDIEKLDIVRIFPPAKEDWNVLYVEFGNEYHVNKVFTYTKRMVKEDHRVVRWFPKQMYDRYREVEAIAYNIRQTLEHKTRVKVGLQDIELCTRLPDSGIWRRQRLPSNLPSIDLDCTSRPDMSLSPPPGRPGREEMLAEAVRGVLSSRVEMEEAQAELARKNEEKKRQHSSDN